MFDISQIDFSRLAIALWSLYIIAIGGWIIMQKRSPASTLSWILSLSLLPVMGFFIYYLFGPKKITRQRLNRKRSRDLIVRNTELWSSDSAQNEPLRDRYESIAKMVYNSTHMPLSYSTEYQLYSGGAATYDAISQAIRDSKEYILLEYYIFENDETGAHFRDLLIEKLQQGVKIYLLVDTLGSWRLTRGFMRSFTDAGGYLCFFHNLSLKRLFSLMNFRNHRKIVICDGLFCFTGGVNITNQQDLRLDPKAYHDVHIQLSGPITLWFESIFVEDWHYSSGDKSIFKVLLKSYERKREGKTHNPKLFNLNPQQAYQVQVIPSGPDTDSAPILFTMVNAIQNARQHVFLTTPYFVPDESSLMALRSAAMRGVDVRILVPRMSDSLMVTLAARSWFDELSHDGVKIYEYQEHMLHSKTLIVDDELSFIGSANFDNRSFYINFEVSLICFDPRANALQTQEFVQALGYARQYKPKKRAFLTRLVESIARLSAPLL